MTLIEKFRLTLAARRFVRRLGPQLRHDYGGGGDYTAGQIRTALRKCGLSARYIKLAYAAFMTEEAFHTAADESDWPAYAALRALYFEWVPVRSFTEAKAPDDPYITWGGRF